MFLDTKLFKPYLARTGSILETNMIHEQGLSESSHPKINGAKSTEPGAGILVSMGLDNIIFDAYRYIAMMPLSVGLPYGKKYCLVVKFDILRNSRT